MSDSDSKITQTEGVWITSPKSTAFVSFDSMYPNVTRDLWLASGLADPEDFEDFEDPETSEDDYVEYDQNDLVQEIHDIKEYAPPINAKDHLESFLENYKETENHYGDHIGEFKKNVHYPSGGWSIHLDQIAGSVGSVTPGFFLWAIVTSEQVYNIKSFVNNDRWLCVDFPTSQSFNSFYDLLDGLNLLVEDYLGYNI